MEKTQKKRVPAGSGTMTYQVIRAAIAVCLIVFLVISLRGDSDSSTSFEDMQTAVLGSADLTSMQEADNQMLRRLYGLDGNDYDGAMLYYPSTNMGAEELLLIRLSDDSQADTVLAAIENRRDSQLSSFEGYGAEQTAMLNSSVAEVRGNYAIFVSASNASEVKAAFDGAY